MSGFDVDAKVWTALIAAVAALIGVAATFVSNRWQIQSKTKEINASIENAKLQLKAKIDEITQTQLKDITAKRIDVYPQLWCILQTQVSDWEREEKPINSAWARKLMESLIGWHAKNGVFLSEPSYRTFAALRSVAVGLVRRCNKGYEPTVADLQVMDRIYSYGDQGKKIDDPLYWSLATLLKDDLGSYIDPALRARLGR